jgi:hypothetical protein
MLNAEVRLQERIDNVLPERTNLADVEGGRCGRSISTMIKKRNP